MFLEGLKPLSEEPLIGVAVGIISDNKDPEGLGRVKVYFPWRGTKEESYWARVATPMAGKNRGVFFLPEVGDEVLVAFEQGSLEKPVVIGGLWNGKDLPPEDNADGQNNRRLIRSRSGHEVLFDDQEGAGGLTLKTAAGQKIILSDAKGQETITIEDHAGNQIVIKAVTGEIKIKSQMKVTIEAVEVKVNAQAHLELSASGTVTIRGALVQIN